MAGGGALLTARPSAFHDTRWALAATALLLAARTAGAAVIQAVTANQGSRAFDSRERGAVFRQRRRENALHPSRRSPDPRVRTIDPVSTPSRPLVAVAGGTYITIWGDALRSMQQGSTRVFLGTDECDVVDYDSVENKVACYTPPSSIGQGSVLVQVAALDLTSTALYASCADQAACTFTYLQSATPSAAFMSLAASGSKQWKAAGQLVRAGGRGWDGLGTLTRSVRSALDGALGRRASVSRPESPI
jgi:hypothetical protein